MGDLDNLNLPQNIGRYQVLRLLGSGAMGSVVLAEDPRIKRKVAIKLMKLDAVKTAADRQEFLARFQREAEVSGLLNHPGIVAIYDVGEEEGYGPFLAMEFVPGKPLDGLMKSGLPETNKEKLQILVRLAEALDHAHAKGITHRDVKPGNVMVGEDGRPKLMDFGIAKREDASLTQTGTFLGTPSYASPEQIKEGKVDNRSDIFSFGVLAFELMSGQSPFPGTSINTILYRIVNEAPVEVTPPVLGVVPDGWQRVFGKVLAKRPEDRYPTCTAFVRELLDAILDLEGEDRREILGLMRVGTDTLSEVGFNAASETLVMATKPPQKRGFVMAAAGILALVVVLGGGWRVLRGARGSSFQIESVPAGAEVFVDDVRVGTTPVRPALAAGNKIRLELKGFEPLRYDFKPGEMPPTFPLQAIVSDEVVDSSPRGAKVTLDEMPQEGVTPLKLRWDQGKQHRISITLGALGAFHDFAPGEVPGKQVFELKRGTTAETRPEPPLDPNAPASIKLAGGFNVHVKLDGKDKGELSPGAKLTVPPGNHKLELSSAHYFFKESRPITLTAGQALSINLPALATVTVDTFPGTGRVQVDGQDANIESDGSSVQVACGRHTFSVRGPRGTRGEKTEEITGDKGVRFPL
jgi:predicted Ser/Thr protein kinase